MSEKRVQQIVHENVIGCQPDASMSEVVQS